MIRAEAVGTQRSEAAGEAVQVEDQRAPLLAIILHGNSGIHERGSEDIDAGILGRAISQPATTVTEFERIGDRD